MSDKVYRIGEASELLALKAYVLRFWETEFPQLVPIRTDKGQRLYSEENLALLRRIKYLLHEQGLTIEGARRILASGKKDDSALAPDIELLEPVAAQSQLSSQTKMGYAESSSTTASVPDAPGPKAPPAGGADEAIGAGVDSAVLEDIIDGLEEVRSLLSR